MISTKIAGIPCFVKPTLVVTRGADPSNDASDWDNRGYIDIEFDVFDRKGYPASWLEAKMTEDDISRIEKLILNQDED